MPRKLAHVTARDLHAKHARSLADVLNSTADAQRGLRRRDRLGERARRLASRYDDLLSRARTDREREAIQRAYEHAAGERSVMHRGGSAFSEPPVHTFGKDGARQMISAFYEYRDLLYRNRRRGERELPDTYRRVLRFLLGIAVQHGRVFPSQAAIGRAVKRSERTVRTALAWLRAHGFLDWQRRLVWRENTLGQREPRQTSNAYRLALSDLANLGSALFKRLGVGTTTGNECRVASNPPTIMQRIANRMALRSSAG